MTLGQGFSQFCVFATFWAFAVVCCCVYLFGNGFCKNLVATTIFDVIFSFGVLTLFLTANLHLNNGEFRIFLLLAMFLGCVTARICFANALDKLSCKLYNLFTTKKVDKNGKDIL